MVFCIMKIPGDNDNLVLLWIPGENENLVLLRIPGGNDKSGIGTYSWWKL